MKDIKFANLTEIEKAAILIHLLGEEAMTTIFKKVEDRDIRKILLQMSKIKGVPVAVGKKVLEEFYEKISESENYLFSDSLYLRESVFRCLGEERGRAILGGLNMNPNVRTLESLEMVDSKSLAQFLTTEHPQVATIILAHVEKEKRGEVLKRLPEKLQSELVLRLSNLDSVDPEMIDELDKTLKIQFANMSENSAINLGGVSAVVELLGTLDPEQADKLLADLDRKDPMLAEEIRTQMFTYEDLIKIADADFNQLLKEVPNDKLILSLKTASDAIKDKFFKNISKRASDMIKEELSNAKPVRRKEVDEAKQEIVSIALRLEFEGKIRILRGGDDDFV